MQARDIRRHHIERLKEKRKHYWGYGRQTFSSRGVVEMSPKQLGAVSQHPQSCSCPACGNYRHHFCNSKDARTLQEQSQIEAFKKIEFDN